MDPLALGLFSASITVTLTLFGLVIKRVNEMDKRLRDAPSRTEVTEEIKARQELLKLLHEEIKEDIKDMRSDIKKILERR